MSRADKWLIFVAVATAVVLGAIAVLAYSPNHWASVLPEWLSMIPDGTRRYLTAGGAAVLATCLGVLFRRWGRRIHAAVSCWLARRGLWPRWLTVTWRVRPGKGVRKVGFRTLRPPSPLGWVRLRVKIAQATDGITSCGLALSNRVDQPEKELVAMELGSDQRCKVRLLKGNYAVNQLPGLFPVGTWHTIHLKATGAGNVLFAADGEFRELEKVDWPYRAEIGVWAQGNSQANAIVSVRGPWFGH